MDVSPVHCICGAHTDPQYVSSLWRNTPSRNVKGFYPIWQKTQSTKNDCARILFYEAFAVLYDKQIPLKRQPTASYKGHLRSNQCSDPTTNLVGPIATSMVTTQLVTYCPVPTDLSIHLLNPTDACSDVCTHWQSTFLFSMI